MFTRKTHALAGFEPEVENSAPRADVALQRLIHFTEKDVSEIKAGFNLGAGVDVMITIFCDF
jgi:hypothetical protein